MLLIPWYPIEGGASSHADSQVKYTGTHLYTWVERSKLEFSALLKTQHAGPHGIRNHDLGIRVRNSTAELRVHLSP